MTSLKERLQVNCPNWALFVVWGYFFWGGGGYGETPLPGGIISTVIAVGCKFPSDFLAACVHVGCDSCDPSRSQCKEKESTGDLCEVEGFFFLQQAGPGHLKEAGDGGRRGKSSCYRAPGRGAGDRGCCRLSEGT